MSNSQCNDRSPPTNNAGTSGGGGGASSPGSDGECVEGEEQEESSSSSLLVAEEKKKLTVDEALTNFREQWQRELESSPRHDLKPSTFDGNGSTKEYDEGSAESKARALFLKGVEHEQCGKFYEAIQFYRRAVQLVPDIEFRLYDSSKIKARERHDAETDAVVPEAEQPPELNGDSEEDDDDLDLHSHLQRMVNRTHRVCLPQHEQQATHISALPMEILLYIMKWVVSADLDVRSLEVCSRVSRGFYLCSRDPEIWRLACLRVWGVHCGDVSKYGSWREMFIERPRLHFNGCYISKTTYVRHGENNFQDQFYRPWHLVEYFRYLRFLPDGLVLMMTTADDPAVSVNYLKSCATRNPSVMQGHYRLYDRRVVLVLRRQETASKGNNRYRRRTTAPEKVEHFHMEFQIHNYRKRRNAQLVWQHYQVITRYRNGQESATSFDLSNSRYPAFWYSRVKSYTSESVNPLQ